MATMEAVKKLIDEKDKIEAEIKELNEVLESQGGVGLKGKLVDDEDYPRADIDVHTVRNARHMVIRLQNDHKAILKKIEEGLYEVHAKARESKESNNSSEAKPAMSEQPEPDKSQAIAKVAKVEPYSPATSAGLKVGDYIIDFHGLSHAKGSKFEDIAKVAIKNQGQSLSVRVLREKQYIQLQITPMKWSGRGLLGCLLFPE